MWAALCARNTAIHLTQSRGERRNVIVAIKKRATPYRLLLEIFFTNGLNMAAKSAIVAYH